MPDIKRFVPTLPGYAVSSGADTPVTPMDHKLSRKASIGYNPIEFKGKLSQRDLVIGALKKQDWIPKDKVQDEVTWFYTKLGIDDLYFSEESVDTIAAHILAIYGAKCNSAAEGGEALQVRLVQESADHAVYIDTSYPGITDTEGPKYEARLEDTYLNLRKDNKVFRLETFRSKMAGVGLDGQELRSYFVNQCNFVKEDPSPEEFEDLDLVSDKTFLEKATANTRQIYQKMIKDALSRTGPVVDLYEVEGTQERRMVIGLRRGSGEYFFSTMSDLYHYHGLTSTRKFVEQFSNGLSVTSIYLQPAPGNENMDVDLAMDSMRRETSLLFCIPNNLYHDHFISQKLSLQESTYAHCVSIFTMHFLNRLGSEYTTLRQQLDPTNSIHQQLLAKLKRRLRGETYTSNDIQRVIHRFPALVRILYRSFFEVHRIKPRSASASNSTSRCATPQGPKLTSPSMVALNKMPSMSYDQLDEYVRGAVSNEHEQLIMSAFVVFNQHCLKTNYFQPTKSALSFRFSPAFLPEEEYPQPLYGMFLVVGAEFRGFHLRFRDVARGGIRIVKSRSPEQFVINSRSLFDENYALASTQQRKNKDIPEGGAKGVILLDADAQDMGEVAFHKYIDSLIDLLIEGTSPNIKEKLVDLHGKPEILFCGPDENTAGLVDWACLHAKARGAPWWKSFFTGKSKRLGGIPHDAYGMTSLSVREYVKGTYAKLGLTDQSQITKIQTGGPDGDLGSNEILLSGEKYIAIIDGSGVLCDPQGLQRSELLRLAKERKMISDFDTSLLSSDGYRVLVDENSKTLPSGEIVTNGTTFRNTAHLRNFGCGKDGKSADAFVPCGGRPEAINISNVSALIDEQGNARLPIIIEGANLFVTQDARLALEKAGAVVFKDASTNKGGVTSSSLEVLAALSFSDEEFKEHMCVHDGQEPAFYQQYVASVQQIICNNASMEFEAMWRENRQTGTPMSVLSDTLSKAIVTLQEELSNSSLWDKVELRNRILREAFPKLLVDKLSLETLLQRVPDAYIRAIFGSYLASRFVYRFGIAPSQFKMYEFISEWE